jgi:hypothetical protein
MDDHLETQDDLKQIEFGVKDMAQEKKDKENGVESGGFGKKLPPKPFKKTKKDSSKE